MSAKINPLNDKVYLSLIAVVILGLTCFVRFRFLGVPLERDEGEYAYVAWQLLLNGTLPYTEAISLKLPGIHFVYVVILAIFGETPSSIHLALLFTNIATSFLIFLLGKRFYDGSVGIFAGASFLVMTLTPSVHGFWANSEHFVIFFAMGSFLLMMVALENEDKRYLFLSGVLLGISILIKQHAIFFWMFGFFYFMYCKKQTEDFSDIFFKAPIFLTGNLTPVILVVFIYYVTGNFDEIWFWTVKYAFEYVSYVPPNEAVGRFVNTFAPILSNNFWILFLSLLGVVSVCWDKTIRSKYAFFFGLLVFSFIAITPGFYFREHYFILLMPSLSMFAGIGASSFLKLSPTRHGLKFSFLLCALFIILVTPLFTQKNIFFKMSSFDLMRHTYGINPFSESIKLSAYIKEKTNKDDVIAILGSEPQVYYLSKRKSATRFIYMYPLTDEQSYGRVLQTKMIKELENSQPKYILFVNMRSSWMWHKKSSRLLKAWSPGYLEKKYKLCGVVSISWGEKPIYYFNDQAVENYLDFKKNNPNLQNERNILIYQKKDIG